MSTARRTGGHVFLAALLLLLLAACGEDPDAGGMRGELPTGQDPPPSGDTNTAPVANAGPDQAATQWDTVYLDGSGSSDGDGDPLSYYWSFQTCPQNVCPGLTGHDTVSPSFVAGRTGTYVLELTVYDTQRYFSSDTMTVTSSPVVPSDPTALELQWTYGVYGTSIGFAGLHVSDLNGDGTPEIVASASGGGFGTNAFWYVLRSNATGTCDQVWQSENYPASVVRLLTTDVNGDGLDDVVVGLSDGSVLIYDGPTLLETASLTAVATLTDLAVADIDGNGKVEVVATNGTAISVYAADTGALLWSSAIGGGKSLAMGNVDADPALEIVTTTSGGKGYVIDSVTRAVEWEYINSFGARVGLGDLDNDGMEEIVGAASWYKITVFDGDRRTPAWEIATSLDIGALRVADADGDGIPDIIYGDGQWGKVHAIDGVTQQELWAVTNPAHGVSGIALGDVDQDSTLEVLWGAGGTSSGADHLYVANPGTGAIKWQTAHIDGPLSAVAVGDVDDDGADEIVMVSFESESGYAEGIVHIFNAKTHVLEHQQKLGIRDWMGVRSVLIGDVDDDGRTEFVVTTGDIYDGVLQVYDGATCTLERQSAGYGGNYFTALAMGDVDGDGKIEIVAGQGREHTGAAGVYLIVFNGATLQEEWKSVDLGVYWGEAYDIELADADGDGHVEIIASFADSRLIVYDGVNHDLKLLLAHPARALEVADVDGDSDQEILAGRTDGSIDVLDGSTYAVERSISTFDTASVDGLQLADLDGSGTKDWLVVRGGLLLVLKAQDQTLKYRSPALGANAARYNHLGIKDTDGDGNMDIFLGDSRLLYQFE